MLLLLRAHSRSAPLALIALSLVLVAPGKAWGHAAFLDAQPQPGTRLQAGPGEIALRFTEPLNVELSSASLVDASNDEEIPIVLVKSRERKIILVPQVRLRRAPYRVEWHTVSTLDGHPLEGSFSFGVRSAAIGSEHSVEQSPLARGGWLRIAIRAIFYGTLFFFAGGVLNATLLAPRRRPERWLVPKAADPSLRASGADPGEEGALLWQRTLSAGALALVATITVAVIEAADAGSGLNLQSLDAYLLTNDAGLARVGTVAAVALALAAAWRWQLLASASLALAFLTIALSGHANSADPRPLALATDWLHLLAAAIWVGGMAQIVAAWLPRMRGASQELRRAIVGSVLARFGRVALPAFAVVLASGAINALIQLGQVSELWQSSYGRVLTAKIVLVALIALASWTHAVRLRPGLLAANPHPDPGTERRHWRLLGAEPSLAAAVIVAAAALVAFPLPPRQLSEADEAQAAAPCSPSCPLPGAAADVLPIAGHAGPRVAAFWLRQEPEGRRSGTLRLLNVNGSPVDAAVEIAGARLGDCGIGCWRFGLSGPARSLRTSIDDAQVTVPAQWRPVRSRAARILLRRAQAAMRALHTVRMDEAVTSGLGPTVSTRYRFVAPDRMAYRTSTGGRYVAIGEAAYSPISGQRYQKDSFGPGGFRLRDFFRWSVYGRSVRWLGTTGRRVEVALFDPGTPVWYRLTIDRRTKRVLREQMVAKAHFMTRRYFAFDRPLTIRAPR